MCSGLGSAEMRGFPGRRDVRMRRTPGVRVPRLGQSRDG